MTRNSEIVSPDEGHLHVEPDPRAAYADGKYYAAKTQAERLLKGYAIAWATWRFLAGDWDYANAFTQALESAERVFTHSTDYSSRHEAHKMRKISEDLANELLKRGELKKEDIETSEMQRRCNDKLWVLDDQQRDVSRVTSDDVSPLFTKDKPADWPNIILTANHARASSTNDLVELLKGIEQLTSDAGDEPLALHRLKNDAPKQKVKGKTIVALACHTERDIFLNGAELIERRCDLEEDTAGNADPSKRTLAHMSPAAMRLAKLMMKCFVEPQKANGTPLVDLDRATKEHRDVGDPYIANAHTKDLVLRADATAIAQHIKLVGYSKGANAVTDALRFLYLECARLGVRLKVREKDGKSRIAGENDISTLIQNIGLLSLAPGEVPLTKAEKYKVGIKRTTILNTHDMTAGHLVNPDAADYDVWTDKLVTIEGTTEELGHSIKSALGGDGIKGYIMDAVNSLKRNYQIAQDEVKAFFASNHRKHAITTLCLSPSLDGRDNLLYVQFAPGVSRAQEHEVVGHITQAFKRYGFKDVKIESDLANRRRLQVTLDHDAAKHPVITNNEQNNRVAASDHAKVNACHRAFAALKEMEGTSLFITHDAVDYFNNLMQMPEKIVADVQHQGRSIELSGRGARGGK